MEPSPEIECIQPENVQTQKTCKYDLDDKTRQAWISQMIADYPKLDSLMCECIIDSYNKDPEAFDEMLKNPLPAPINPYPDFIVKDSVSVINPE